MVTIFFFFYFIFNFFFHFLKKKGEEEDLKYLLEQKADVNYFCKEGQLTPFIEAVLMGRKDLLKLLVDHGANVNAQDEKGRNIFHMISGELNQFGDLVPTLIELGVNPNVENSEGFTFSKMLEKLKRKDLLEFIDQNKFPLVSSGTDFVQKLDECVQNKRCTRLFTGEVFSKKKLCFFLIF